MAQILYKDIIKNKEINEFIKKGDANLATLGYTEHSKTHCTLVAERAAYLLEKFGHADAEIELAKIAGYMHDIGNAVNREHHAEYGALLVNTAAQLRLGAGRKLFGYVKRGALQIPLVSAPDYLF